MELTIGSVVISRAGHDKGRFYAVVALTSDGAFVCDGASRPLEKPKRKNPAHLAVTRAVLPQEALRSNKSLRTHIAERFPQSAVRPQP